MFCKNCGQQVTENDLYCPNCGTKIEGTISGYTGFQVPAGDLSAPPACDPNPAPDYNPAPAPVYNPAPAYNPEPAPVYNPEPAPVYNPAPAYNPNPAPAYNPGYNPGYAPAYQPAAPKAPKVPGTTGFSALGSNMVIYFISLGVMLMNIIFMYCPQFSVLRWFDFSLYGSGISRMDDDLEFLIVFGIIILLGYIGGMVLSALPLMTNKKWSGKYFICSRVTSIVALSFYMLFVIILLSESGVSLTFWGVMYIMSGIGSIVLSFLVPKLICKKPAAPAAPAAPGYYPPQY